MIKPVPDLVIIVHKALLELPTVRTDKRARETTRQIQIIKRDIPWLEIAGDAGTLHPKMPRNGPGFRVEVAGAYRELCCARQVYTLRKTGYDAGFHEGCLPFDGALIFLPPDADKYLPEMLEDSRAPTQALYGL